MPDSETRYRKDLQKCPPMSAEEAYATAVAMRAGDKAARARFIQANTRLVYRIAKTCRRGAVPLRDRIAAGNIGLIVAVDKFEPERGLHFCTMARWWIQAAIVDEVDMRGRLVHLPAQRQDTAQIVESFDAPISRHGVSGATPDFTLHDVFPDDAPSAHDRLEAHERARYARSLLHTLRPRERAVLLAYFGDDEENLSKIGKSLGVSRERVRQIRNRALEKLRKVAANGTDA